ncbi:MAG: efflux RND transporter periplasmic adaptor subunit [Burkholderiaceae bacterium]
MNTLSSSPEGGLAAPSVAEPESKRRRWPWVILVLLILGASVGGFIALQAFKPKPVVKPLTKQVPIVRLAKLEARSGSLPVIGNGLVTPRNQVSLAAEAQGRIVRLSENLVSGGQVQRGELLLALDASPFKAALAQARADRQSASAALSLAEQSIKRTKELIEQGFLSRQTLDERIANRDQARAALARARAVESQRRIDLSRTAIAAPFDGRVLSESVSIGDMVQPGRELARLFDANALEISVSLTSKDMSLIDDPWAQIKSEPADAVLTVNHGGKAFQWSAQVDRVEAAIDSTTRTFNVVIAPTEPGVPGQAVDESGRTGPPLVVGMYATARIAGRDLGEYFLLPRRALRDKDRLWVMTPDNEVAIVRAEVLTEIDDEVAVRLSPVPDAIGVITSDLKVVTPGMAVRTLTPTDGRSAAREARGSAPANEPRS